VAGSAIFFCRLPYGGQHEISKTMGRENFAGILMAMAYDERTGFLQNLPTEEANRMLALLPAERRDKAARLLRYRKDSVGRLMTPDFIAIQAHWTVQETLEHIRTYGRDSETLNALYAVDARGRLLDDIKIRELCFNLIHIFRKRLSGPEDVYLLLYL
jgi:magnesium transporter